MKVITTEIRRVKAEGYGPFDHVYVCFENEQGERLFATINPTLWKAHGLAAIGMTDWFRGDGP